MVRGLPVDMVYECVVIVLAVMTQECPLKTGIVYMSQDGEGRSFLLTFRQFHMRNKESLSFHAADFEPYVMHFRIIGF